MIEKATPLAHGEIDVLILQALVRKLVLKGVLSSDDVRALLFDAAMRLDLVGSDLTPQAAHVIVEEDLAPAYVARTEEGRELILSAQQPLDTTDVRFPT
jgi:hypothetical protein